MRNKKLLLFALAATMMMGTNSLVMADDQVPTVSTGTEAVQASAQITKKFELAEGITIPTVTFHFDITKITSDAPDATIDQVSYDDKDNKGTLENGKYVISKNAQITFGEFTHTGVYEYKVKERQESFGGVTYADNEYTLRVYVANKTDGGFYIQTITAESEEGKEENILFTNTYKKDASLEITKNVTGDMADKTKDFEFEITFVKSGTEDSNVTSYTGKIGEDDVTCKIGQATRFKLHDGQSLVFDHIPAGTRYIVTEIEEKDDYTPSVKVVENGTATKDVTGTDGTNLTSVKDGETNNLIGENENNVVFTNAYKDVPRTGMIINNLPFICTIAVAFAGIVALTFGRRKRS